MNLSQLKMFLEVVRRGSLSEAARRHNLTQPAVTRKMQRLEKELGTDLFVRGEGHHVTLTAAGRDFKIFAEKMLHEYHLLQEAWRAEQQDIQGVLSLAASTIPGEFLVPRILADFTALYPRVKPSLVILDSSAVEQHLIEQQAVAGFTGKLPANPRLLSWQFWEDEVVLAVPPAHRLAGATRHEIELSELAGEVLLEREQGSGTLQSVHRILAEKELQLPPHKVAMVLGSTQAIVSGVAAGLGSGFISTIAASKASSQVVPLRIKNAPLLRPLYIIVEENQMQNGPMLIREFINFVLAGRRALSETSGFFEDDESEQED